MTRSVFLVLCLLIFIDFDVCSSQSSVSVHFNTSTLTVVEGSNIDIQLVAQGRFDQNFTVNLTFTDGTARYLMDYFYPPLITPSVTFTPGSISSSVFDVTVIPNNIWEGTKSFEVGFDLPSDQNNLESGRPDTLRVNIADDDSVRISFKNSTQTVREGSGKLQLQLKSSGLYGRSFTVSFTCIPVFPTEAENGDDFTGGLYTVHFQTLRDQDTISSLAEIPIRNDLIQESTEHFTCVILKPREDGIIVDCLNTIDIEIEDDDALKVSFEKAVYSGEEGGILSDIRLKATEFEIPFSVQIFATTLDARRPEKENEATSGVDYTDPRSLVPGGGVVQFDRALGLLSTLLTIPILSDNIAEGTEYFALSFFAISNGEELGIMTVEPTMAMVCINDTNVANIAFKESSQTVVESAGVVELRLVADTVFEREQFIDLSAQNRTANSGLDYVLLDQSVRFLPNSTKSGPIRVQIVDNMLVEPTETFTVMLMIPGPVAASGGRDGAITEHTIRIEDDDTIFIQFEKESYEVSEGDGNFSIRLELVNGTVHRPFDVSIEFMEGTALENEDFLLGLSTNIASFGVGTTESSSVTVGLIEDNFPEGNKDFTFRGVLDANTATRVEILPPNPRVTIIDNDSDSVKISFQTSYLTVRENSTSVLLQLQSHGMYGKSFSVSFICNQVLPVEAKDGDDFTAGVHTVQFGENSNVSSTAEIAIVDDSLPECTESFICVILRPTGGIGIVGGDPNTITVVIEDDDPPFVQFFDTSVVEREGKVVSLRVNRSRTITRKLKCTVRTELITAVTAIAGDDYRLFTSSIEFKRQNAAFEVKTIYLQLLEDNLSERKECFSVVLDCRPKDLTGCYPPSATVCIQEN